MTASDAQGDTTQNLKTVTQNSNRKDKGMNTSNRNLEQKILSNRTLPVKVTKMKPRIDQRIAPILVAPQTLLTPVTKEVAADAAWSDPWVNRTLQQVRKTSADGSTPCDICNAVSVEHSLFPVLIAIVATYPPCGLSGSLQVTKKRQFTPPGLGGNTQKWTQNPDHWETLYQ